MKLLAKVGLIAILAGAGVTIYAAPSLTGGGTVDASLEELTVRAREIHDRSTADTRHVQHLQQIARKQKDVIKLNCVNDKLVQMKAQLNVIDQATLEMQVGTSSGGRSTSFTEITQAGDNVRNLREQADSCIGEPTLGTESANTYTHPNVYDPTTENPFGSVVEPPGYASPFN
jgi:hypothetical protein